MKTTFDVVQATGLSPRVLDHWVRAGYIPTGNPHPGSGVRREFTDAQARAAEVMATLVRVGFRPERAAAIARALPPQYSDWEGGNYRVRVHIRVLTD